MEENFDRVVGLVVNEEVNEMLPPDKHPPLIDNKGHEVILPEQGQELVGEGHFVSLYLSFVMCFVVVVICLPILKASHGRKDEARAHKTSLSL